MFGITIRVYDTAGECADLIFWVIILLDEQATFTAIGYQMTVIGGCTSKHTAFVTRLRYYARLWRYNG